MRTKLLILILLGLLVAGVACEPDGGGVNYQYLGRVESVRYVELDGTNWTGIRVGPDTFRVAGRVDIPKLIQSYVWINLTDNILRIRVPLHDVSGEYTVLSRTTTHPGSPLIITIE